MHEVLVNRLGGLSLPRKSVVRLTDRPDMTLVVYRGRKTTIQPTNKDKSHIPKHFYVGKRKAQILHTRLRTNCSSLNLDLFMRNISDSPLCQCGSVQNAQHFFFHCRNYHVPRTQLFNTISQYQIPSLSLLLYGNDSFSVETNTVIFETVHKFILDSKRF